MSRFAPFVLLALLAFASGCGKNPKKNLPPDSDPNPNPNSNTGTSSDRDRLQGVWKAVSFDAGGGAIQLPPAHSSRLQFEGDQMIIREKPTDGGEASTVVWDETKSPKTLALTPVDPNRPPPRGNPNEVWIYKFEGDDLVIAYSDRLTPTEFKGDTTTGVRVLRFTKTNEKPVPLFKNPVSPPTRP